MTPDVDATNDTRGCSVVNSPLQVGPVQLIGHIDAPVALGDREEGQRRDQNVLAAHSRRSHADTGPPPAGVVSTKGGAIVKFTGLTVAKL